MANEIDTTVRSPVGTALTACLEMLHDRKDEIDTIFDENRMKAAWAKSLVLIGEEIENAVKGRMIVPEYSQRGAAKQMIYAFIGTHWEMVPIQMYYDFVKDACRKIGLAEELVQNQDYMNRVFENVAFRVSKHISTAQPHDGVWINLHNGTIEIYPTPSPKGEGWGGAFREHRAEDFFLYCLPYDYDPEAECPRWLQFLDEVLPEKDSQTLLGEYIGYCFTQNLRLEKMAVLYGGGANGKSVCMDVIKQLLGRANVSEATLSSITNDPEARAMLQNKLVNISSESGKNLNPAILKMLISGEAVEMRILYVGTKLLYNPPKLITSYNELPPAENTHGYRRRWILFPFNKTIADNRQDPALAGKLCLELPGILNWVLQHLAELVRRVSENIGEDFTYSRECKEALASYFKSSNSASLFVEECCHKDDMATTKLKDMYADYQNYCRCTGIQKPVILKNFKKFLIDYGATLTTHLCVIYVNMTVDRSVYM